MTYCQKSIGLRTKGRGVYDITSQIEGIKEISRLKIGLCHVFIKHTSASITLSQKYAKDNMEKELFNKLVPERNDYIHNYEGSDDMPAHGKCVLVGSEFTIPITDGKLNLGKDQGIWLCEHRNHVYSRNVTVTIRGCK